VFIGEVVGEDISHLKDMFTRMLVDQRPGNGNLDDPFITPGSVVGMIKIRIGHVLVFKAEMALKHPVIPIPENPLTFGEKSSEVHVHRLVGCPDQT
jgi:hypothetical protein